MVGINPQGYGVERKCLTTLLTNSQIELCKRLDSIHKQHDLEMMPSAMFQGAIYASDRRLRSNPDWVSQAANSLREILYPFLSKEHKGICKKNLYQDCPIENRNFYDEIGRIYNLLNGLAHHGNAKKSKLSKKNIEEFSFDQVVIEFENLMREVLKRQLDLYSDIDIFFKIDIKKARKKIAIDLIKANPDALDYFFNKAPITKEWITWLHQNNFFDILNKESKNKTTYSYKTPELDYLIRVVESKGDETKVVEVMKSVKCAKNFNPEVVDRFLWIAKSLSAKNLVKIIPKIKSENWIVLMKDFKPSGYNYSKIVKTLVESKANKALLALAEVILTIDPKSKEGDFTSKYFYLDNVYESGIFEALTDLKGADAEKGLKIVAASIEKLTSSENDSYDSIFSASESFYISDLNFFDLNFGHYPRLSYNQDIRNLLEVFGRLIESTIGKANKKSARKIFDSYLKNLPDSQTLWRAKLFAMSFQPQVFDKEIKTVIKRLFLPSNYEYGVLYAGPEYLNTLKKAFPTWKEPDQTEFINKALSKFKNLIAEEKRNYYIKDQGWKIFSVIKSSLSKDEKKEAIKLFGKELDKNFKPKIDKEDITGGSIHDGSPVTFREPKYKDIQIVINDLKAELAPSTLKEKYRNRDFLNPINAEGVGNALKKDMKARLPEYLTHADKFLDPKIHIHYTNSFLMAIQDHLREKNEINEKGWDSLLKLFKKIKDAEQDEFQQSEGKEDDRWLARWEWIEKTTANILKYFLTEKYVGLFTYKRKLVLELIDYLLKSEDPKPENEVSSNTDLFHIAINSTRGVAFQALVNFAYQDGDKLKSDVADLYEKTITKPSPSVRFVIGHYLASFYYRDKKTVAKMLKLIFPTGKSNHEEFIAAWEGYLANPLYPELFEEMQEYYMYALQLDSSLYPNKRKTRDIDKGIANHLALAFAHFDNVHYKEDKKHQLLKKLWDGNDTVKQREFISFLGGGIISKGDASKEWFKKNNIKLEKLQDFWELLLTRDDLDKDVYSEFGFWINDKVDIFDDYKWLAEMIAETLTKSKGKIDRDNGLLDRLPEFAESNPDQTLIILNKFFIEGIFGDSNSNKWVHIDNKIISVFEKLYMYDKAKTKALINKLLPKGGRRFWPLKDIVDK